MIIPTDPLKTAMDATKAAASNAPIPVNVTSVMRTVDTAQTNLNNLAKYKDLELIKKEAEAKVMALTADKQQEVLAQKAEIEKQVAEKLTLLLTLYLSFPPKLPASNPKALAKKAYEKTKKELRELKQSLSKENLKKGKDAYKYPMKLTELATTKIPEIPKLPNALKQE
jgi:hypothetical protein